MFVYVRNCVVRRGRLVPCCHDDWPPAVTGRGWRGLLGMHQPHPTAARGHRRPRDAVPARPPPYGFDLPGRVEALLCTDPGLPKGSQVYAYQLDNHADYEATWQSFNKVIGFNSANAGPNCPPAKGGQGTAPMRANRDRDYRKACAVVEPDPRQPGRLVLQTSPTGPGRWFPTAMVRHAGPDGLPAQGDQAVLQPARSRGSRRAPSA